MRSVKSYHDRRDAGKILAAHVQEQIGTPDDAVVLALPRGGVPVGFEVARALGAQFDVFVVRKLGAPGFEEFAIGAIATGGFQVLNDQAIAEHGISKKDIAEIAEREAAELRRREELYRADRPPVSLSDRVVILVDDGLATGFTMRAAIAAVRACGPRQMIVAVPVGAVDTCAEIEHEVSTLICPLQPDPFRAVGLWYHDFGQTTDDEVRECLAAATLNYETTHKAHSGS